MNEKLIREKVKEIFEENGLVIFSGEEDAPLEIDSFRLISLIVAIENMFEVEVPDEFLSNTVLSSYNDFCELLLTLLCS